ncbi:MAG: N-acetyl-gamma-glutamyl-phosphate reductase [Pseudomonadota bacterium]
MTITVFIDGEAGTTGLQIHERLRDRDDISVLQLGDRRKDPQARCDALNTADVAILCLPDDAALEAVAMIEGDTRVIDASTAHRIADGWTYGMPELTAGQPDLIAKAKNVANVGCYATGSIALLRPLTERGVIGADTPLSINAVSGYTGGGKALIAEMTEENAPNFFLYAMTQGHKHLPEIMAYGGLSTAPVFQPSVGRFAQGMIVSLPLHASQLTGGLEAVAEAYREHYANTPFVTFDEGNVDRLDPEMHNDTNQMSLHLRSNADGSRMVAFAVLDNLGKGASGSAVQNLDLMIGATLPSL